MRVLGLVLTFIILNACGTGKRLIVPTPLGEEFTALDLSTVYALSENNLFVAGRLDCRDGGVEGIVLRSQDAGAHWRRVGAEIHEFRGLVPQNIHFADARRGWLGGVRVTQDGTSAVILRTTDSGHHWRERAIAISRAEVISEVRHLEFENDDVGNVEIVFLDIETGQLVANLYRTIDGGKTWVIDDFADNLDEGIVDSAEHHFSDLQGYRLDRPDPSGVQSLNYTASKGKNWRVASTFHVSRFGEFYTPLDERTPGEGVVENRRPDHNAAPPSKER